MRHLERVIKNEVPNNSQIIEVFYFFNGPASIVVDQVGRGLCAGRLTYGRRGNSQVKVNESGSK